MAYTKQTWQDLPSKTTPINASRLGHIEQGIYDAASTADTAASNASSAISGLAGKVDKVEGKGLSTNDFTDALKTKLDNIEAGAEVNVQADYAQTNTEADDYIKNKPSLGTSAYKNSTSVVTDSTDLVESGAVFDAVESAYQLVEDTVGWTGKNLLKVTADTLKALNGGANTWTGNTKVINNVTWEIQTDGDLVTGIKASGTNNNSTLLFSIVTQEFGSSNFSSADNTSDDYFASTGLSGDANDTYKLQHQADNHANYIRVQANYPFGSDGVIFKPMICRKDLIDKSYEPYHASVEESKADNSVIGTVENGTTVQKSGGYAVGSHAIRNGKFITWKNAKAQGETINDVSDYDSGDVADELNLEDVTSEFTLLTTNLTFNSTYSKFYKQGNLITLNLRFTVSKALSGNVPIFTKPIKYQPKVSHLVPLYNLANHECVGLMFIDNVGTNAYVGGVNIAQGTEIVCSDTYFI